MLFVSVLIELYKKSGTKPMQHRSKDAPQLCFTYGTFEAPSYLYCILQDPCVMKEQFII